MKSLGFRIILMLISFIILFFLFSRIEFDLLNTGLDKIIQPIILALTCVMVVFYSRFKAKIIYVSLGLLVSMVFFYSFGRINLANSLGSIGFGVLTIVMFSYLPQIFKNGIVEKL